MSDARPVRRSHGCELSTEKKIATFTSLRGEMVKALEAAGASVGAKTAKALLSKLGLVLIAVGVAADLANGESIPKALIDNVVIDTDLVKAVMAEG